MKFNNLSLTPKLIGLFLAVSLIPLAGFGFWSIENFKSKLIEARYNQLDSIRELKKGQLESFFSERRGDLQVLSDMVTTYQDTAIEKIHMNTTLKKQSVEAVLRGRTDLLSPDTGDIRLKRRLNSIVQDRTGLGTSGETYLIYENRGRIYFGSDLVVNGGGEYVFGLDFTKNLQSI